MGLGTSRSGATYCRDQSVAAPSARERESTNLKTLRDWTFFAVSLSGLIQACSVQVA
jgi:hypothetical protein